MSFEDIFHDYREDIIKNKHKSEWRDWSNWENWNVLYKTLSYELSSSKDVESFPYVRESILDSMGNRAAVFGCVGDNYTFDIMNGWWFCFIDIFNIKEVFRNSKNAQEKTNKQNKLEAIMRKEDYDIAPDLLEAFRNYLKVVYTIGNITPVPYKCNKQSGPLDNWEFKLKRDSKKYMNDYMHILHFEDYYDREIYDKETYESDKIGYLEDRTKLILARGLRIYGCKEEQLSKKVEKALEELKKYK